MSDDVTLVAGTIVEHLDAGVWKRVPRLGSTGEIGSFADAKEKTTVEDRLKRYGSGLRDAPDKNFKGQRIPVQLEGSEHFLDRELQNRWLDRCKNEEEMQLRVTWPDMERCVFTFKPLGYAVDDSSAEDWKMFTVNGKQNSFADWSKDAPTLTAVALTGLSTMSVAEGQQMAVTNTPVDAFWEVNQDRFETTDSAVISVTKWGYVTAISAGVASVTVIRNVGDGTTVTESFEITVS